MRKSQNTPRGRMSNACCQASKEEPKENKANTKTKTYIQHKLPEWKAQNRESWDNT